MDRLEYIMWRDTIRYKCQLEKTLQLGNQEIEDKIDELEITIGQSMPYFFEGKDSVLLKTKIDHNMGFHTHTGFFVATEEDYNIWRRDESVLLFCGEAGDIVSRKLKKQYMEMLHSVTPEEFRKKKIEAHKLTHPFYELSLCPLRSYQDIISKMRSFEYYNKIDFTNLENVKKIFRENYIYTGKEFCEQNGYDVSSKRFMLPNGQKVIIFGYEKSEYGYSGEDNEECLFDE